MKAVDAIAEILKREGVEVLIGYPVNHIIESAAEVDIRTIMVRQERTGLHMADAVSRVTSGRISCAACWPACWMRTSSSHLAVCARSLALTCRTRL